MKPVLIAIALCLFTTAAPAAERPNLILIMVDDIGQNGISCYGGQQQTPNLDKLAKAGVRYETVWCAAIESSAQVSLLTGQYPFRHQYDASQRGLQDLTWTKQTTFARRLRESGYATAVGGHWRLNRLEKQSDALQQHGFDEHCVWTKSDDLLPATKSKNRNGHMMINGHPKTGPYDSKKINSFLIDFIRRKRKEPFLLFYPMPLDVSPRTPTPETTPDNNKNAEFAADVTRMDQLLGELIEAVDNSQRASNTLIVFTGGNGVFSSGSSVGQPLMNKRDRGSDWGVRIPLVVRAPFLTSGGRVSKDLIDSTDFYPTFLELAEIDPPKDLKLDGRSFVPSLRGSEDPFEKRSWIFAQVGDFRMVRDWQHILDTQGNFHDLIKDPHQQRDVSPLDKIAPGRRQRLEMILNRFPQSASVKAAPTPDQTQSLR